MPDADLRRIALRASCVLNPKPGRLVARRGDPPARGALHRLHGVPAVLHAEPSTTRRTAIFSVLFFLAELLIYIKSLSANLQMFWQTNRSPDATQLVGARDLRTLSPGRSIFSSRATANRWRCCAARSSAARRCAIRANRSICSTISAGPQMRALAQELGCHYRDRPDNRDAKAGNMNAALPTSQRRIDRGLRCRLHPDGGFPDPHGRLFRGSESRPRADAAEFLQRRCGEPESRTARRSSPRSSRSFSAPRNRGATRSAR